MISHCPLATLLPWSVGSSNHCPALDCSLLQEGDGGVALQRYQARSPESSPRHWKPVHDAPVASRLSVGPYGPSQFLAVL
ncbi:Ral guanine nucleotide dissociation stimulator-like 1 [Dissostichus eleginoides]|uniref:Ral guanine nucleotide dissociation stimulator-like 1 n=1 Tax=Dissostichus eleginoides TaxID=100907 RepID=A0AAD9C686_DISEL|nr:Ral guanine nucleotide dissociation stimulator-like 1 [Dissostichus eleginoides]